MWRLLTLLLALCLIEARGQTVVVLPFSNLSGSSNLDWIGESISEAVRESLSMAGIQVLDRESRVGAYRTLSLRPYAQPTLASTLKVGEVLDADEVVFGAFQVSPARGETTPAEDARLKLTVRVVNLKELQREEVDSAEGAFQDLAEVQSELAWLVLQRFAASRSASAEDRFLKRLRPVRLDALEDYIRGLLATSDEQKHRFFTQAARLDERFSQPCYQLGRMLWRSKNYSVAAEWLERVSAESPNATEAAFLLGLCRYQLGEYAKAESSFRGVAGVAPLSEVWNNLGAAESRRNLPEALESFRKAISGAPNDPAYRFNLGYALWKQGEFEAGAEAFRVVLNLKPEDSEAILMLGRCLRKTPANAAEMRIERLERIKTNFEELAYRLSQYFGDRLRNR